MGKTELNTPKPESKIIETWKGDVAKPKVSICCITYNHEKYIEDCLVGFLIQKTDFPYEILIHDDASTDRTADIIRRYEVAYPSIIKPVYQVENQYSKGNRPNQCFNFPRAKGEYIAFCEGDDYWTDPLKLQLQVEYLDAHTDVGLVHSGADTFFVETGQRVRWYRRLGTFEEQADGNVFLDLLTSQYVIRTLTVVVRKALLFDLTSSHPEFFDRRYPFGDYQMWLLLATASKFKFINESLATHNILSESATHSKDVGKVVNVLERLYELKIRFCRQYNCHEIVAQSILYKHYEMLIETAFVAVDREVAYNAYEDMKKRGLALNAKQKLLFLGASSRITNSFIRSVLRLRTRILRQIYH